MRSKIKLCTALACIMAATINATASNGIKTGAEQTGLYINKLKGKRVTMLANQTSVIGTTHIVDSLHALGIDIKAIFAAEHGFRGDKGAGVAIENGVDTKTGIKIISLYGKNQNQNVNEAIKSCDFVVVDIQDVGTRFYTYYITMLKLMDKCAEFGKKMILLDRPNPNGHYVDGPILDEKHKSGVGMLPIPVVHGMTLGELAMMINGEGWLADKKKCDLEVVKCANYTHNSFYSLPVPPSPNLPDMASIYLYPSLCYFEGTPVSVGRGTDKPFTTFGHPEMKGPYSFTPKSTPAANEPPCKGKLCHGYDLSNTSIDELRKKRIDLSYVITAYNESGLGTAFFTSFFEKLIGVDYVRQMIIEGKTAKQISETWKEDVAKFKEKRKPYLLYEE